MKAGRWSNAGVSPALGTGEGNQNVQPVTGKMPSKTPHRYRRTISILQPNGEGNAGVSLAERVRTLYLIVSAVICKPEQPETRLEKVSRSPICLICFLKNSTE